MFPHSQPVLSHVCSTEMANNREVSPYVASLDNLLTQPGNHRTFKYTSPRHRTQRRVSRNKEMISLLAVLARRGKTGRHSRMEIFITTPAWNVHNESKLSQRLPGHPPPIMVTVSSNVLAFNVSRKIVDGPQEALPRGANLRSFTFHELWWRSPASRAVIFITCEAG